MLRFGNRSFIYRSGVEFGWVLDRGIAFFPFEESSPKTRVHAFGFGICVDLVLIESI